jgi:16S rRNA (guanine527-N7)-methyltransferase
VSPGVLERWLAAVVGTPGLTALRDTATARAVLLEDALRGLDLVGREAGPIADVGSGGGSPGIPLAASLPSRSVTLIESERRKCTFLSQWIVDLPNLSVVWGRAEEQPIEAFGVVVAKALAAPPVAAELCLPLVREGGIAVLWVGPTADHARIASMAGRLGAETEAAPLGFVVLRKLDVTPPGFPRRPGMAKKRPLS